jgi:hypothetical protein
LVALSRGLAISARLPSGCRRQVVLVRTRPGPGADAAGL